MSLAFLVFVLAFAVEAYQNDVLIFDLTPAARAILMLPLVGAALGAATVILTGAAWVGWNTPSRCPYWSFWGRIHHTLVALTGVVFVWWLSYWNLLVSR